MTIITKLYILPSMLDWTPESIKTLRKTYNLPMRKLGELLGVSITSVYQWERGVRKPSKTVKILLTRIEEDLRKGVK